MWIFPSVGHSVLPVINQKSLGWAKKPARFEYAEADTSLTAELFRLELGPVAFAKKIPRKSTKWTWACATLGAPGIIELDLRRHTAQRSWRDLLPALLLARSRAFAPQAGSTEKLTLQAPSSWSRLLPVLACANAVHFGRDVKACAQNDSGLPVMQNFQRKVRKPMWGATARSPTIYLSAIGNRTCNFTFCLMLDTCQKNWCSLH